MVLDKNLSVTALRELLEQSGQYIDLLKLGWGTTVTQDRELVAAKCALCTEHDVWVGPGGTLTELAYLQGKLEDFLAEAKSLGMTCIEVSDGTVPMSHADKLGTIERAHAAGFKVVSEVGSKITEEDQRLSARERIEQTQSELAAGAWKVIVEARESGTHGIFDSDGKIQSPLIEAMLAELDPATLLFEAPQKQQQAELIVRLGNAVNLGNIAPQDLISLETLRLGVRSDTLRHFHAAAPTVTVELGVDGAMAGATRGDIMVVVDALRASSTIVAALGAGMVSVKPVASADECVGEVTAGERGGHKIASFMHDNSPSELSQTPYVGKALTLTTSNGTECILAASSHGSIVLIGALLNAAATAAACQRLAKDTGKNVTIVVAGRNGLWAVEDHIVASEIAVLIKGAPVRSERPLQHSDDFVLDFLNSDSGKNLAALGKSADVLFCAQQDIYDIVPVFKDGALVPLS